MNSLVSTDFIISRYADVFSVSVKLRGETVFQTEYSMNINKENIEKIRTYLTDKPVLKAYLFGSYVRGEATENSDIDLLVELDYSQTIGLQFIQMQLDLEALLGKKVDLVSTKGISKYIEPIVNQEKQLVYAR